MKNRINRAASHCRRSLVLCLCLGALCPLTITACTARNDMRRGIDMQDMAASYTDMAMTNARDALYHLLYGITAHDGIINATTLENLNEQTDYLLSMMQAVGVAEADFNDYFSCLSRDADALLDAYTVWAQTSQLDAQQTALWQSLYTKTLKTFGTRACAQMLYQYTIQQYDNKLDTLRTRVHTYQNDKYLYPYYVRQLEETKAESAAFRSVTEGDFVTVFQTAVMLYNVARAWNDGTAVPDAVSFSAAEVKLLYDEASYDVQLTQAQWAALFARTAALPGTLGGLFTAVVQAEDTVQCGNVCNAVFILLSSLQGTAAVQTEIWDTLLKGDDALRINALLDFFTDNAPQALDTVCSLHLGGQAYVDWLADADAQGNVLGAAPVTADAFRRMDAQLRPEALSGLLRGVFD